jgi:hypothetical protein
MQKVAPANLAINVAAVFLLIGLAIMGGSVYFGWRTEKKIEAVAAWPTTPAYVVESRIEWAVHSHTSSGTTRQSYSYSYELPVLAGYQVAGRYYTSATPAVTTIRDRKLFVKDPERNPPDGEIVALFRRVPQGAVVPIHYNPANPGEAYLFTRLPFWKLYTGNVVAFGFGTLAALFGLVPVLLTRRYAREASRPASLSRPPL